MDKLPFELEELHVVAVDGAAAGQVVVPVLQADDAVFVRRMPFGVEGSVAEGEEPLTLPAQLRHLNGGLGLLVEEHLQLGQFFLGGKPYKVAEAFHFYFKFGKRY